MAAIAFDTLKYIKTLTEAGFDYTQPGAQAIVFGEAVEVNLATK